MTLNQKEHEILSYIYELRVMSFTQIRSYIFTSLKESHCAKTLQKMVAAGYLEKNGFHKDNSYYFVTTTGINQLKNYGIVDLCSTSPVFYPDSFLTASKLKILEKNINHQLSLNEFVLLFCANHNGNFSYYDEKFVGKIFSGIRPDGLIRVHDTYYFLEMDMCTERKSLLDRKWKNYKNFFYTSEAKNIQGKIRVLFLLGGKNRAFGSRTKLLCKLIDENLWSFINDDLCFHIGVFDTLFPLMEKQDENLLNNCFDRFHLLSLPKFSITDSNFVFDRYLFKQNKEGKIQVENTVPLEFLFDDFTSRSMYVFKKLKEYASIQTSFRMINGRFIKYVIQVNSEQDAYELADLKGIPVYDIYFTTKDRLSNSTSIYDALFTLTPDGTIMHFKEGDMRVKIPERRFTKY